MTATGAGEEPGRSVRRERSPRVRQVLHAPDGRSPIGVFDSGIGGLTVVRQILALLPREDVVYFGDTARVPYGIKSKETVTRFSRENTQFLLRRGVRMVVVACNSASAMALDTLQHEFDLPIVGVIEPGAAAAVEATRTGRIGVIGTQATVRSGAYERAIAARDSRIQVLGRACPLFVPLAEEGWTHGEVPERVAQEYLGPLIASGIDTLILGCTHYPILEGTIRKVVGDGVTLIDTAVATVREVADRLARDGQGPDGTRAPSREYYVSDVPAEFRKVGERFLGRELESLVWVDQDDLPWYER